jgi:hypothetical protein
MLFGALAEHTMLVCWLGLVSFLCFDEESFLDFSDLNILHVWVCGVCVCVIVCELVCRAAAGQAAYKDLVVLVAVVTFWLNLENYFRVLLLVFVVHALLPVEADLLDLAEVS